MWRLRGFRFLIYLVIFIHVYGKFIIEKGLNDNGPLNITSQRTTTEKKVTWYKDGGLFYISEIDISGTKCKSTATRVGFNFYCEDNGLTYKLEVQDITANVDVTFVAVYSSGGSDTHTISYPAISDPPTTTIPSGIEEDCFTCNAVILTIAFVVVLILIVVVLLIIHFKYLGEKWITKLDVALGCVDVLLLAAAITCTVVVAKGKECYKDCEDYWKAAVGVDAVAFVMVLVIIIELIRCHHGKCC